MIKIPPQIMIKMVKKEKIFGSKAQIFETRPKHRTGLGHKESLLLAVFSLQKTLSVGGKDHSGELEEVVIWRISLKYGVWIPVYLERSQKEC